MQSFIRNAQQQTNKKANEKSKKIDQLLQSHLLWRASHNKNNQRHDHPLNQQLLVDNAQHTDVSDTFVSTGFAQVDQQLHYSGWPLGNLIECLAGRHHDQPHYPEPGSISLFLPAINQLASPQSPIILVAPPHIPYLPGWFHSSTSPIWVVSPNNLTDLLWSSEQILRSNTASTVMLWLNQAKFSTGKTSVNNRQLRKLQLAAKQSRSLVIVQRSALAEKQASPAPLRIALKTGRDIHLHILKQPGHWAGQTARINWHRRLQTAPLPASEWPVYRPEASATYPSPDSFKTTLPNHPVTRYS